MENKTYDDVKPKQREIGKPNNFGYVVPRADIRDAKDYFVVQLEMPGINKESLSVRAEKGHLVVQGMMNLDTSGELVFSEILKRNYRRVFKLSDNIENEKIQAKWNDGILTLILTKKESAKPKQIEIKLN